MMTLLHDSQYTPPLLLRMIVAPLPVTVVLCRFPDPIEVVVFSTIDSDVMFMMVLFIMFSNAKDNELQGHDPSTQHAVLLMPWLLMLTILLSAC